MATVITPGTVIRHVAGERRLVVVATVENAAQYRGLSLGLICTAEDDPHAWLAAELIALDSGELVAGAVDLLSDEDSCERNLAQRGYSA